MCYTLLNIQHNKKSKISIFKRKRVKITPELCKIDHLYHLLHFGIKNTPDIILRDQIYPQELTPDIFIDLASHVRLILSPKHYQLGFITKELDLSRDNRSHKSSKNRH